MTTTAHRSAVNTITDFRVLSAPANSAGVPLPPMLSEAELEATIAAFDAETKIAPEGFYPSDEDVADAIDAFAASYNQSFAV